MPPRQPRRPTPPSVESEHLDEFDARLQQHRTRVEQEDESLVDAFFAALADLGAQVSTTRHDQKALQTAFDGDRDQRKDWQWRLTGPPEEKFEGGKIGDLLRGQGEMKRQQEAIGIQQQKIGGSINKVADELPLAIERAIKAAQERRDAEVSRAEARRVADERADRRKFIRNVSVAGIGAVFGSTGLWTFIQTLIANRPPGH